MPGLHRSVLARAAARLPWIVLAIVLGSTTAAVARGDDPFEPVRQQIAKLLVDENVPSVAVAVARDGKIIWEQGFGWADRENRVPASEHTLYSVASVSKPIAATGLMVLKDRKLIDLDKPANDYLGEAKLRARVGNAAEATVRRVANHTSGLPLHYQFFYAGEAYHPPSRDETIRRYGNLVNAPGEHYQYSNLGYGVLDYIIERVSQKRFTDFMREEVFLPLGMTHTSIDVGPGLEPHQAIRYTPDGKRIPFYEFDHPGASAVYASAHDLARFAMFHVKQHLSDQRPILSDASIDEMQVATAAAQNGDGYGIGWSSGTWHGYQMVDHSGGMPGVATLCTLVPSEKVAVVVLTNTAGKVASQLSDKIINIVLPEPKTPPAAAKPADPAPAAPTSGIEMVGTWKGKLVTYKGETPLVLSVKESGDVHARLGKELMTLVNSPVLSGGYLRGVMSGVIDNDDTRGRPYFLQLELKLRDKVLNGSATAITSQQSPIAFAITHWVELEREAVAAPAPPAAPAAK